ncbi:MAG TPA: hypothetical protein VN213_18120 [Solirubrobacteraceae bacterium]|nr:hypothetical protein [Solirubrobacteraceae bacterium]
MTAAATAAAALAAPAAAHADQVIAMPGRYFTPAHATVLTGEKVTWRNDDLTEHDVAAAGAFVSGRLARAAAFSYSFSAPGTYAYRCTIHAFMNGDVTVLPVILEAPDGTVLAGNSVQLTGRAPAGTPRVGIERTLDGTTWTDTGVSATPEEDGGFSALVPAEQGTAFRAVVAGGTSKVVTPRVAARVGVTLRVVRGHHGKSVQVRTTGSGAGLYARLETYRRARFMWRGVGAPVRLDRRGTASFTVPARARARARVVLTATRTGNSLVTSRPVRLSDGRPSRDPLPPPPADAEHGGHAPAPAGEDDAAGAPAPGGHGDHPA